MDDLFSIFNLGASVPFTAESLAETVEAGVGKMARTSKYLQQPIFNGIQSEHEMLRYLVRNTTTRAPLLSPLTSPSITRLCSVPSSAMPFP